MPRQARLEYQGGLYHVLNRGIERRMIFTGAADYVFFRKTLSELIAEEGFLCYAWALMPNHFHLLLERGKRPLSRLMSRLSTAYAGYYNRKYRRAGRLFQNRYQAILCEKEGYFKELVAYIHLNPLRAKRVDTLSELKKYRWSGHRALLGKEPQEWQAVEPVLERFGRTEAEARKNYLGYLSERQGVKSDFSGGGLIRSSGGLQVVMARKKSEREEYDTRVLGDGSFVRAILGKIDMVEESEEEQWGNWEGLDLNALINASAVVFGVSPEVMCRPGKSCREVKKARALVSFLAVEHKREKRMDLAERFRISAPAVTKLYFEGERLWTEEKAVRFSLRAKLKIVK